MTKTEIYALQQALKPELEAEAKGRQGARTDLQPSGIFPEGSGQTRDKIGAFAGVSGKTVEKIAAVMEAAECHGAVLHPQFLLIRPSSCASPHGAVLYCETP